MEPWIRWDYKLPMVSSYVPAKDSPQFGSEKCQHSMQEKKSVT